MTIHVIPRSEVRPGMRVLIPGDGWHRIEQVHFHITGNVDLLWPAATPDGCTYDALDFGHETALMHVERA